MSERVERVAARMVAAVAIINWDDPDRENVFRILARVAIAATLEPTEPERQARVAHEERVERKRAAARQTQRRPAQSGREPDGL